MYLGKASDPVHVSKLDGFDGSVDEELAGWSHSKNSGQWFNVQEETSDKEHSSGVGVGTGAVQDLGQ